MLTLSMTKISYKMLKNDRNESLQTQRFLDHVKNGVCINIVTGEGSIIPVPKFPFTFFSSYCIEESVDCIIVSAPVPNLKLIASLLRFELYEDESELDAKKFKDDALVLGISEESLLQLDNMSRLKTASKLSIKEEIDDLFQQKRIYLQKRLDDADALSDYDGGSDESNSEDITLTKSSISGSLSTDDMDSKNKGETSLKGLDQEFPTKTGILGKESESTHDVDEGAELETDKNSIKAENVREGIQNALNPHNSLIQETVLVRNKKPKKKNKKKKCVRNKDQGEISEQMIGNPIRNSFEINPITGKKKVKSIKCKLCEQVFERNKNVKSRPFKNYTEHWLFNHENCNCEIIFSSKRARKNHILTVHKGGYPCEIENCFYILRTEASYEAHKIKHHSRELACEVTDCNFVTNRRINLEKHDVTHQRNKFKEKLTTLSKTKQSFSCDLCEYTSFSPNVGALNYHRKSVHGSKPCEICGDLIKNEYRYKEHLINVHNVGPEKRFKCDQCEAIFSSNYKLTQHILVHSDEKFCCRFPNCENRTEYNEPANRNAHERKKHGLNYSKFLSEMVTSQ